MKELQIREGIMGDCIALPIELFDSNEYRRLPWGTKRLLLDLYIIFNDCEFFTIDLDKPEQYRQSPKCSGSMSRQINELIDAGMLVIDSVRRPPAGHRRRIFRFGYPVAILHPIAA